MGFIAFLLLGLIAGAIAKALMPGKQEGGWIATLVLGVIGAMVGGWLGGILLDAKLGNFWDLKSWVLAIGGSLVVLAVWGALTGKKR
ncbi:GlsB/YeaQ/YmgE family stress response membrane protein [Buchananella felis]|uniref:GlsB/YeaQ/YmgE family stress response membrane protein n=1 Tax=Buchananella felis TaxID=3231492 RepID=UPI003526E8C5